jgi:hypothetical protein
LSAFCNCQSLLLFLRQDEGDLLLADCGLVHCCCR